MMNWKTCLLPVKVFEEIYLIVLHSQLPSNIADIYEMHPVVKCCLFGIDHFIYGFTERQQSERES